MLFWTSIFLEVFFFISNAYSPEQLPELEEGSLALDDQLQALGAPIVDREKKLNRLKR